MKLATCIRTVWWTTLGEFGFLVRDLFLLDNRTTYYDVVPCGCGSDMHQVSQRVFKTARQAQAHSRILTGKDVLLVWRGVYEWWWRSLHRYILFGELESGRPPRVSHDSPYDGDRIYVLSLWHLLVC